MSVRVEKDGAIWTVVIDRPEARNAVNPEAAEALEAIFALFETDQTASVAVLWGAGGAFCAGYDLKHAAGGAAEIATLGYAEAPEDDPRGPMGPTRMRLSKPVIAAIAGPAVAGGMELALWCDLRVMEESAYMGVFCRRWGVPLIDGGTVRLPRLIGEGRALDLILTGRKVEADEALRIGLADRAVPEGTARAAAEALARDIARFPQDCLRADRASALGQSGLSERDAMAREFAGGLPALDREGLAGAGRFAGGRGRSGDFDAI